MLRSSTTPFLARLKSGQTHQRIRNGMAVYATWIVVWTCLTDYQVGLQIEQVLHHSRDSLMSYLFKPLDYLEQATPQIVRNRYHQALPHLPRSHALSNDFDPKTSLTPRRHISDVNFARLNRHGPFTRHRRGFSFRPGDDTKPADPHSTGLEPSYRAGFSEPDTTKLAARRSPVRSLWLVIQPVTYTVYTAKRVSTPHQVLEMCPECKLQAHLLLWVSHNVMTPVGALLQL